MKKLTFEQIKKCEELTKKSSTSIYNYIATKLYKCATGAEKYGSEVFNVRDEEALTLVGYIKTVFAISETTGVEAAMRNIYRVLKMEPLSDKYTLYVAINELNVLAAPMMKHLINYRISKSVKHYKGMTYEEYLQKAQRIPEFKPAYTITVNSKDEELYHKAIDLHNTVTALNDNSRKFERALKTRNAEATAEKLLMEHKKLRDKIDSDVLEYQALKIVRDKMEQERINQTEHAADALWQKKYNFEIRDNPESLYNKAVGTFNAASALYKNYLTDEVIQNTLEQIEYEQEYLPYEDLDPRDMHDRGLSQDIIDAFMVAQYKYNLMFEQARQLLINKK